MRKAIYAGSFDPLTNGHLWVIKQASELFDKVLVVISHNPEKKSLISIEDREKILNDVIKDMKNVRVEKLDFNYTAKLAKQRNASYWIRGVRNASDLEYEKNIIKVNKEINPDLKTVVLIPPDELSHISSSLVKSLVGFPGWESVVMNMVPPKSFQGLVYSQVIGKLKSSWDNLADNPVNDSRLTDLMTESHRYYHSVRHVLDLITKIDAMKLPFINKKTLKLAAWFHDIIYDPTKKDNEEKSNEYWINYCKENDKSISYETRDKVSKIILATKNHTEQSDDELVNLFLDLDLSILGSCEDDFKYYDSAIRKEYGFVPDDIYATERKKVLTHFLNTEKLFKTQWGHKFEAKAKENLKKSLGAV